MDDPRTTWRSFLDDATGLRPDWRVGADAGVLSSQPATVTPTGACPAPVEGEHRDRVTAATERVKMAHAGAHERLGERASWSRTAVDDFVIAVAVGHEDLAEIAHDCIGSDWLTQRLSGSH